MENWNLKEELIKCYIAVIKEKIVIDVELNIKVGEESHYSHSFHAYLCQMMPFFIQENEFHLPNAFCSCHSFKFAFLDLSYRLAYFLYFHSHPIKIKFEMIESMTYVTESMITPVTVLLNFSSLRCHCFIRYSIFSCLHDAYIDL
jgi:hypothetical protein